MLPVEVVPVARKPDVFVRAVNLEEGRKLAQVARPSKQPIRMRRAVMVMASAQHQTVGSIARLMRVSESHVRQVIHDFDEKGFDALDPKWKGGRPVKTDSVTRDRICQIARCCPRDLGWSFSAWSLSKLAEVLRINGIADISRETLRRILKAGGVSWPATKTWKASNDPEFTTKMARVLDLYDHPPADGRVVCVDEFGPLNLRPRGGRGWFPKQRPARLRATYHRTQGVRHMFGALDLATGQLHYRIRDRKRWTECLAFLKSLRGRCRRSCT
ncbi:IS630 family transposase [Nocardia sp. CY41]|uniref:IS630 family transposase n=1 Tax=Nocardia sp. CY41 TaxID=2608686 RepID=UPI001F2B4054|nr:IS630 family transposase [Nocardia sp. CY41]